MSKLLKKTQIITILIFFLLSKINTRNEILDKKSEYYESLIKNVSYSNNIKKYLDDTNYDIISKDNIEYLYFFNNKYNLLTLFFKEKHNDYHTIYFDGIDNSNDIMLLLKVIFNKFSFENIENILYDNVDLYIIDDNNKINNISLNMKLSLLNVFDYLINNVYETNLNIQINGYSLGGPFSQVFAHTILKKYKNLKLEIYNIESWFGGNKEIYNDIIKNSTIVNIYNKKSLFYYMNIFCQKYFKSDYIIAEDNRPSTPLDLYLYTKFPYGIINYIKDNHKII